MDTLRTQHGKKAISAVMIIIAVLFQLYLTSTAALNPTHIHSENWLNQVQDEKVLMCTADGFKWVDINELIEVDKITAAKREWNWLLWQVNKQEQQALAVYAAEKDWHHLTVKATIEAKMWDHTALRFPIAHQWWFNFYGDKHKVDPITLMSVARQESALDVQARSPVGARGIMQIMPTTASYTAKRFKLSYKGAGDLYDVGKNIEIGSRYLNSLLQQYDDNRVFAFAAYNAGPHRVKRWRKRSNENLDVFAFIEAIPFKETRGYVQNILMFETYYRDLMGVEGDFLRPNELLTKY